jgi:bacterioferritin-associated ferredoxin
MALRAQIKRARVPIHSGARDLAAHGTDRVEGLSFRCGGAARDVAADTVLLHNGVVPNVQITRQLDCTHQWDPLQRYWRPVVDEWGRTSVARVSVAGDGAGIFGAPAAETAGRLTVLNVAVLLGAIPVERRDSLAAPLRQERAHHLAVRPMLDHLFRPHREILAPPDDATLVCRCEEITAGAIRESVALGCLGPNQLKAFTRCGMGPCQGRMCGLTTAEVIAEARGVSPAEVGYFRIRPPIKPLTLGELAALEIPTADPEP